MHRNGQFPVTLTGSPGRLANKTKRLLFIYLFAKRIISGLLGVRIWLAFSANVSINEVIRSCGWRLTQQPCWASRAAHRYFKQWPALYSYCHTVNTGFPVLLPENYPSYTFDCFQRDEYLWVVVIFVCLRNDSVTKCILNSRFSFCN